LSRIFSTCAAILILNRRGTEARGKIGCCPNFPNW